MVDPIELLPIGVVHSTVLGLLSALSTGRPLSFKRHGNFAVTTNKMLQVDEPSFSGTRYSFKWYFPNQQMVLNDSARKILIGHYGFPY